MDFWELLIVSTICCGWFVEGIYKLSRYDKSVFSKNKFYYLFLLGKGLMTICFGLFLYGFNFNENIIGYTAILWFISMYISTYYAEDLKSSYMNGKNEKKFLKIFRAFLVVLISFLVFAAIRAKYLGYY